MHNSSVCCEFDESDYFVYCIQEKIKDVPVSGSEGVKMKDHEGGSGEDLSSLELTQDDGECVLLYTVNTTHCTHYCDSDTCL